MRFFRTHKRLKWLILIPLFVVLFIIAWPYISDNPADNVSPIGQEIANCQREFAPKYTRGPYYQGELFDAHFHVPVAPGIRSFFIEQATLGAGKDVTLNEILCLFDKEKTRGALAFYLPKQTNRLTIPQAYEIKSYARDKMSLFISPIYISNEDLEKILNENPALFDGIGEIFFYEMMGWIKPIDGDWAKKIYKLAGERNLPVMIHPCFNQVDKLEKILQENPNTTFILHGRETEREIGDLMSKYSNIYYSVDSAALYAIRGKFVGKNRDEFISEFKRDFNSILEEKVEFWKYTIERYPDRFMWGTDRGAKWHYEEELSSLMEEFARAFIGRLDPSVQEKYAYKNAEMLLGK